jgi:hypothetical protein
MARPRPMAPVVRGRSGRGAATCIKQTETNVYFCRKLLNFYN